MAVTGLTLARTLALAAGIVALIVIVFLGRLVYDTKEEITQLRDELRETRQSAVAKVSTDHFSTLDKNCTWCHNERRYLGYHGDEKAIGNIVDRMSEKAGAKLSDAELRQIHEAMDLLACVKCHDQHTLDIFSTYTPAKQSAIFDGMWRKPGSGLKRGDSTRILSALHSIQGF